MRRDAQSARSLPLHQAMVGLLVLLQINPTNAGQSREDSPVFSMLPWWKPRSIFQANFEMTEKRRRPPNKSTQINYEHCDETICSNTGGDRIARNIEMCIQYTTATVRHPSQQAWLIKKLSVRCRRSCANQYSQLEFARFHWYNGSPAITKTVAMADRPTTTIMEETIIISFHFLQRPHRPRLRDRFTTFSEQISPTLWSRRKWNQEEQHFETTEAITHTHHASPDYRLRNTAPHIDIDRSPLRRSSSEGHRAYR